MVMIPSDVGVRMRMQTEPSLQPVLPATEVAADIADFRNGQVFTARIQEVLPENTYKALVAGRSLTLSLPEGAKAGDTLELVVVDRTPQAVIARLASGVALPEGTGELGQFTTLSKAAQLIATLLPRDGETPSPAPLTRGQALLQSPPVDAPQLAARLSTAVTQSGLFYEAHQVQWAQGQRPLASLLAEPQAAHSNPDTLIAYRRELPTEIAKPTTEPKDTQPSVLRTLFGAEETRPASPNASTVPGTPTASVPEELRPLIQQQLDAAATQRLAWHGEVWPGQHMNWEIEPDDRRDSDHSDADRGWITSLRLTMPRLGAVDARLHLTHQGLNLRLLAPDESAAADLRHAAPALESALAAAGIRLQGLQVSLSHEAG